MTLRGVAEPVGIVASHPIIDVLYKKNGAAKVKSILVKVGPDEYREIFSLNAYYHEVSLSRSRIIGDVLATMDLEGGAAAIAGNSIGGLTLSARIGLTSPASPKR